MYVGFFALTRELILTLSEILFFKDGEVSTVFISWA
jgi:hypothetical protein